ncbi:MAG: hypothetical protein IPP68_05020 [Elusimicrobia bacterium]|nr:hypothetical protein [Elusimicrobiota bacterium]
MDHRSFLLMREGLQDRLAETRRREARPGEPWSGGGGEGLGPIVSSVLKTLLSSQRKSFLGTAVATVAWRWAVPMISRRLSGWFGRRKTEAV